MIADEVVVGHVRAALDALIGQAESGSEAAAARLLLLRGDLDEQLRRIDGYINPRVTYLLRDSIPDHVVRVLSIEGPMLARDLAERISRDTGRTNVGSIQSGVYQTVNRSGICCRDSSGRISLQPGRRFERRQQRRPPGA